MKLDYIKANGKKYYPREAYVQDPNLIEGCYYPVCFIKKLFFGRWQIDYYDDYVQYEINGGYSMRDECKPNARIILYPSGIEEVKWLY